MMNPTRQGQLRKNLDDLETNGFVGDWAFVEGKDGLHIFLRYPNADNPRGDFVNLPIAKGESISSPVRWGWNGSREAPTLTPSILINGGDGNGGRKEYWHGYLTDGKLVSV